MRKKGVFAAGVCAAVLVIAGVAASATTTNLITNGDAESNGTQGWIKGDALNFGSTWCVGSDGGPNAFENVPWTDVDAPEGPGPGGAFGSRVFIGDGDFENNACMYQKIDVRPHHALTHYTFTVWLGADDGSGDNDDAKARVCFLNDSGSKIGCSKSLTVIDGGSVYAGVLQKREATDLTPHAAAWAVVEVALDEDGSDNENEAAFDNASLTLWGP
jgi:hypothetical protein